MHCTSVPVASESVSAESFAHRHTKPGDVCTISERCTHNTILEQSEFWGTTPFSYATFARGQGIIA